MRADVWAAVLLLALPGTAQRGVIKDVTVSSSSVATGGPVAITVTGTNPCGAVRIDYGDGSERITHPLTQVPATIQYVYTRPGNYRIGAEGMGNCDGEAFTTIRVLQQRTAPPAAERPQEMQFREIDDNRDGVVTLSEWRGNAQSFRRADRNRDGVLSRAEFLDSTADEDRTDADLFRSLDVNRNGVITPNEWHSSRRSFDQRDQDGDGVLTRNEFSSAEPAPVGTPGRQVIVNSTVRWTDAGVYVREGELVTIESSGTVQLSGDSWDVADPAGARSGRRAPSAPFTARPAGGLIARVGDSAPIFVGDGPTFRAPANGQLYLGVNDDHLADNRGEFRATISVGRRNR